MGGVAADTANDHAAVLTCNVKVLGDGALRDSSVTAEPRVLRTQVVSHRPPKQKQ